MEVPRSTGGRNHSRGKWAWSGIVWKLWLPMAKKEFAKKKGGHC
jgi:hypothetical protein